MIKEYILLAEQAEENGDYSLAEKFRFLASCKTDDDDEDDEKCPNCGKSKDKCKCDKEDEEDDDDEKDDEEESSCKTSSCRTSSCKTEKRRCVSESYFNY